MIEVDARGLSCPIPVVKAGKAMDADPGAAIRILVDNEVARENVARLASTRGYAVDSEDAPDGYVLTLDPGAGVKDIPPRRKK